MHNKCFPPSHQYASARVSVTEPVLARLSQSSHVEWKDKFNASSISPATLNRPLTSEPEHYPVEIGIASSNLRKLLSYTKSSRPATTTEANRYGISGPVPRSAVRRSALDEPDRIAGSLRFFRRYCVPARGRSRRERRAPKRYHRPFHPMSEPP